MGHAISGMAKIIRVSGDCSLREVLQEVGFDDGVDDVLMQRAIELRRQTFSPKMMIDNNFKK